MNSIRNLDSCASISANKRSFVLDRPFILTQDKTLVIRMPYMYNEGNHSAAVRLLHAQQDDSIIYLYVQELGSQYNTPYFLYQRSSLLS